MIEKMILRRFFSTKSSTMRAWVSENGSGVELKEVPLPVINKPGQVLLKVKVRLIFLDSSNLNICRQRLLIRSMLTCLKDTVENS